MYEKFTRLAKKYLDFDDLRVNAIVFWLMYNGYIAEASLVR